MNTASLQVKRGRRVGDRYPIGERLLMGRDIDCDVQLFDEGLSRTHFLIERKGEAYEIKDLGSSNGTYVNGKRVLVAAIHEGDVITAGSAQLIFSFLDGTPVPPGPGPDSDPQFVLEDTPASESETKIKKRVEMDTLRWVNFQQREQTPLEGEQASKALAILYKIGNLINAESQLERLYTSIIDAILEIINADRAFLILWNPETGTMDPVVARSGRQRPGKVQLNVSRTVVEECVKNGLSILSSDAMADSRFKAGQSVMLQNIRSVLCVPLESHKQVLGAIYLDTLAASGIFLEFDLELVSAIGRQAGVAIERARLMSNLQHLFYDTIRTLVATIEAKDKYTAGHSERVTAYAVQIAQEMGMDTEMVDLIHLSGLLHDIGKVGISEKILNKPSKLTDEEFEIIKTHPVIGAEIVKNIQGTEKVVDLVRHHHERWDGRGYPDGLKGEGISLPTRILTVADCYDAMTSSRAYRNNLEQHEIIAELERCTGTQFDPRVAPVFVKILREGRLVSLSAVYERGFDHHFSHYFEKFKHRTSSASNPVVPRTTGDAAAG